MSLILSTSWNSAFHKRGGDLIYQIKKLGFEQVELNFKLSFGIVAEINELVQKGQIRVRSLHNYCPIPEGIEIEKALPDCLSMSSTEEAERQSAVKQTKHTIATAADLGADAVVLHCGRVRIPDRTLKLIELFNGGKKDSLQYLRLKDKALKERADNRTLYFESALRSIEELNCYAEKKKISLGIENRFYLREIPDFAEIGQILERFKNSRIFFWHDTGHAQVLENLGFTLQEEYLKQYGLQMIGMHLHDVKGSRDHLACGQGELNFASLAAYVKKETLKVIEAHHPASEEDIVKCKKYLESVFHEGN